MFTINPDKTSREEKNVPNTVRASNRTKLITVSQPPVFTKKDVNSDLNGLSSTGVDITKTRRPQPRRNTKHDRVPSASKSSRSKNKEAEDVISKVVCAICKQYLISINHDVCLHNYVNGKKSRGKKQMAKVSFKENQKKYQPKVTKPKKVGFPKRLATSKPRKPRFLLRWSPTGRLFDQEGKLVFLLFIDDKFEEWAWSCELTSFWPAATTVGIPAAVLAVLKPERLKADRARNTMTDVKAPPVRSNDQCLLRIRWVQTGYLKFSANGTKREVFGMPVPGSLITADLREVSYYQEYLANVVKHRWLPSGEPTRKPNPTAQKVRIHILQYLIHLRMCKDILTKMMKMFLLVENLRQQNPDNREALLVRSNDQCLPRIRWVQTGYLKFSAKGTKREVFGMPVPGSLITADLREVLYYQEYLANVVKHRWFLSSEPARKPNPTAQKVRIHILQYLIHLRMCKDVPTKIMKMFLLVENLWLQNPDNREKHLLFTDIEDSVMDPVTHKSNPLNHSRWQSALAFDHSKSKRTIESRAKRSSKIISLGHYSVLLASSYTVKSKAYFKSPTHYPCVGFNSLVHSLRALSALRLFGLRTASTAAKPCQGDSSEFYLITGRIPTVAAAGQKDVNSQLHAHSSNLSSMTSKKTYNTAFVTLMYAVMIQDRVSMRVLMSQPHKMEMFHNKDD
nr:hypothetical protein [Tanacetum cinerariifolium]